MGVIKEVSLFYYQNIPSADVKFVNVPSGFIKYNLKDDLFVSGQPYSFKLQVVDVAGVTVYSNAVVVSAPWNLSPPSILSYVGLDQAIKVQLASTDNVVSSSDTSVEFALKRNDNNEMFIIAKPYVASGSYTLSVDDNSLLINNTTYQVACQYQPLASNTKYSSPSALSETLTVTPTNLPNAPGTVTSWSLENSTSRDLAVKWGRPSDFSEWSDKDFSIKVSIKDSLGVMRSSVLSNNDTTAYNFTNLDKGLSFFAYVQYINIFGEGPVTESSSGYVTPTTAPDAPTINEIDDASEKTLILDWSPPEYKGQTPIINYNIYMDDVLYKTVKIGDMPYIIPNLVNGKTYTFKVTAVNKVGESPKSEPMSATPYGAMSISSVTTNDRSISVTINPNGRSIDSLFILALDADPNNIDDKDFILQVPKNEIPQDPVNQITITKAFADFTSAISFYCVIVHNAINVDFKKSST
eukprot:scaffold2126_cov245-Ochromonas_danica.AAC.1